MNHMEFIAERLNVSLKQKFSVYNTDNKTVTRDLYRFTENGLFRATNFLCDQWEPAPNVFMSLMTGRLVIIKHSYVPEEIGKAYWTYDKDWNIIAKIYNKDKTDAVNKRLKLGFKTCEDAEFMKEFLKEELNR